MFVLHVKPSSNCSVLLFENELDAFRTMMMFKKIGKCHDFSVGELPILTEALTLEKVKQLAESL